jgi:hypothetical protein
LSIASLLVKAAKMNAVWMDVGVKRASANLAASRLSRKCNMRCLLLPPPVNNSLSRHDWRPRASTNSDSTSNNNSSSHGLRAKEEQLVRNKARLEELLASQEGVEAAVCDVASSSSGRGVAATQDLSFSAPPIDWGRYHLQVGL